MLLQVGYAIVIMYGAAVSAKGLGASILGGLALFIAGTDVTNATYVFLLWIPAFLLANFRD